MGGLAVLFYFWLLFFGLLRFYVVFDLFVFGRELFVVGAVFFGCLWVGSDLFLMFVTCLVVSTLFNFFLSIRLVGLLLVDSLRFIP